MKTEAETGVRQPQAKQHLEPPEAGRDKEICGLRRSLEAERAVRTPLLSSKRAMVVATTRVVAGSG